MSIITSRVNLLPTVRSLGASIPLGAKVNHNLPIGQGSSGQPHGTSGPRSDQPPSWAGKRDGSISLSRLNALPSTLTQFRHFSTTSSVAESGPGGGMSRSGTISATVPNATGVPDFSKYRAAGKGENNRTLSYFMVGALGVLSASSAKATVSDILSNLAASADVLALAKIEVEMGSIPEGKNLIVKWRGKPVFIRHRTADEIEEANAVDVKSLRDPQKDEDRVKRPEWLVMLGVCTHLGCVPIGEAGDYGGWFCPCHGSHYDISGRIRRGPAPLNLEVPAYDFNDEEKIVIG